MRLSYSILLASSLCLAQAPSPVISFDKSHHYFGRVLQGQKVSHSYKATNIGNAPLQIKEVRSSCDCSFAVVGKEKLAPGGSTFIDVHFDSAGMMGSTQKTMEVISDDPASSTFLLTFEAVITLEIMPSASAVFFNIIPCNGSASSSIRLESGSSQPVGVTDASIPNAPYLSCDTHIEGSDVVLNVSIDGRLVPKESSCGTDVLTERADRGKAFL